MEYPFKLSEIIAGCESGAWLEGAVFQSDYGVKLKLDEYKEISSTGPIDLNGNWGFVGYVD